jgi:hypothetical protein
MKHALLILLLALVTMTSCDYIVNIDKTGNQDTIYTPLQSITSIDIQSPCKLILTNVTNEVAMITGPDFIIDGYELTHEGEHLMIRHKQSGYLQKEKLGHISIPATLLKSITLNAPCQVSSNEQTFTSEHLSIVINGKGIYSETNLVLDCQSFQLSVFGGINQSHHQLKGKAKQTDYYIEGVTDIDATELVSQNTSITHRSNADCRICCTQTLHAIMYSTGSLYYIGSPQVNTERRETTLMKASGTVLPLTVP